MDSERIGVHRRGGGGDVLGENIRRTGDYKAAVRSSSAAVFSSDLRHLVDELFVRIGGDIVVLHNRGERYAVFVADVFGFRLLSLHQNNAQQAYEP